MYDGFVINVSEKERKACLVEIRKRIFKIIYVFEKTENGSPNYDYKKYVKNILRYVSSADELLDGELMNIKIHMNTLLQNDLIKSELKSIVFECENYINYLLRDGD